MSEQQQEDQKQFGTGSGDWTYRVIGVVLLCAAILFTGFSINQTINDRFSQVITELRKVSETVAVHGVQIEQHDKRVGRLEDKR